MVNTNKKTNSKQIIRQIFLILSGLSFASFSIIGVVKMLQSTNNALPSQQESISPEEQLEKEAQGYKLVLEREPDNRFALENLVQVYLKGGDLASALPLMEKLVAIEPQNQSYQEALGFIKQGLAQKQNPPSTKTNPSSDSQQ